MFRKKFRNKRTESGQGLVEFALALPIFLLAVFGIVEFGRFFLVYSSVYTASREAARYGSSVGVNAGGITNDQDCAGMIQVAMDTGFFGGITASDVTISYESIPGTVVGTCPTPTQLGDRVLVQVDSVYQPIFGIIPEIPITASNGRTIMKDIDILGTPPPTPNPRTPVPLPPVVDAGPDQVFALPTNTTAMNATVLVDGNPAPPSVRYQWTMVSGPGGVNFSDSTAEDPAVTFPSDGVYVLQLTATNGPFTDSDIVTITVQPQNQPPVVNAGPDLVTILPNNTVFIDAYVTDDGYPDPPNLITFSWSVVSGPGTVTFTTPTQEDTNASFSAVGFYVLELSVSDGGQISRDQVTVELQAGPTPTPTMTPTITPTPLPTNTPVPTATPTATPIPCDQLRWTTAATDGKEKYWFNLTNQGAPGSETFYIRSLQVIWVGLNQSQNATLQQVLWGAPAIWSGNLYSPVSIHGAAGSPNPWNEEADLTLAPGQTKQLTLVFSSKFYVMQNTVLTIQLGDDPYNICQVSPPAAR